jgi:enamine deaminase RidA (YjgF/YER057c/UK114 family)
MMQIKPKRLNPEKFPSPVGKYSHVTIIPRNSEIYTFSGQIGIDIDGNISEIINNQIRQTFINIKKVLESQEIGPDHVIKVNVWATEELDWDCFYKEWEELFGAVYPSMTIAYIKALGLPELKVEIEIWAAKP